MSLVSPLIIWQFVDGKAGHEQQSEGFINALEKNYPIQCIKIDLRQHPVGVMDWLLKRLPDYPMPHYVIGAGHSTHLALLTAKRITKAKAIVLMKPSLPTSWFDYALIPEHDKPTASSNVLVTQGVLNTIEPSSQQHPNKGLMLLGGPSKRHGWDEISLVKQMLLVLNVNPHIQWQVSTSRRTPEHTLLEVRHIAPHAKVWSADETPQGWIAQQLQQASQVWVTEDSISMIYEGLTAGAQVGVLAVPRLQKDRITQAVDELAANGQLVLFNQWQQHKKMADTPLFCEAKRAAQWLLEQEGLWQHAIK
jgi:mitochondrial fission protein ELM1